jgi:hypothetical protein
MDAVVYSVNSQIHAFDEASLSEALDGQAATVFSARAFCGGLPIFVSPVTLKPRFNAVATVAEAELPPDHLPDQVDPRQMSLFGAAWTAGSVKQLAESGAASVTYYETTGWRGVMEARAGTPLVRRFPSWQGMIFPLYHVLADLAEWPRGELIGCQSSEPLVVRALAVRANGVHALVCNMTPREQEVLVGPFEAQQVLLRRLNEETAVVAMSDSGRFRAGAATVDISDGFLVLRLAPFEVARIDVQESRRA